MLFAPKFMFVLVIVFGSTAALLLLRKKFPNKKVKDWTPWLLATIAAFFIVYIAGAHVTSKNPRCRTLHQTTTQPPNFLETAQDYFDQGDYEYDKGNCAGAIENYSIAIDMEPDFAEAYNNRAYTYMMLDDYASALPDLDMAIELQPNYVNALMNRGDIYNFAYKDRAKAMEDYDRVFAIDPHHGSICGHRMLARNNGWTPGAYWEFLTGKADADCR